MPALQYIRAISDTDQRYYPETLNRLFLVNAPSAFVMVWKIVKGWLDPGVSLIAILSTNQLNATHTSIVLLQTIDKIQILGKDYKQVLLEHIEAENLPDFLGGTCTCDHMPGGCVPSQSTPHHPPPFFFVLPSA